MSAPSLAAEAPSDGADPSPETPAGDGEIRSGLTPSPRSDRERTGAPSVRTFGGLAALAAGVLALVASAPIGDNSAFTHLATGRYLVEHGWPDANPFLAGSPADFPIPSWWWSGILAVAERVAGLGAVRLVTVALAAVLGLLVVRLARGASGLVAALVPPALALLTFLPFLTPRPHLAGYVLLAAVLVVWRERMSPWWVVPAFAAWVNLHGTWTYGVVALGLLAAASALDSGRGSRVTELRRCAWLVAAAVVGVVAGGLLYPETFRLVLLPAEQLGGGPAREVIQAYNEWRAPSPGSVAFWTLVLLGGIAVVASLRTRRFGSAVVALLLTAMGLGAQRLVPVAAISLVPLAATALDGVGTLRAPVGRVARALGVVGIALCVVAGVASLRGPHLDLGRFPTAAVDWLEERDLVADTRVSLVHQDYVGNYLELRYGADANAYTDDRPDLDRAVEYLDLIWARDGWRDRLDAVDADVVLWDDDKPLNGELESSPEWERVERFDGFSIWCRRGFSGCR